MSQIFNKVEQKFIRRKLRHAMTKSETVLWKYLRRSQIGFKFRRQCGIGSYIVDFYCPEVRLIVEIDGITHYNPDVLVRDRKKDAYFQSLGLQIRRYSTEQIFYHIKQVVEELRWICCELRENHPLPPPS